MKISKFVVMLIKEILNNCREMEAIRKHTNEEACMDYPRRLVNLPGKPMEVQKGQPGFLGTPPLKSQHVYLQSECARQHQLFSHPPVFTAPVTLKELHKFFGILIYSSKYHVESLKEFWSTKPGTASFPEAQMALSYKRFALIYRCFCFYEEKVKAIQKIDPTNLSCR